MPGSIVTNVPLAAEYSVAAQVPGPWEQGYHYFINNGFAKLPDGSLVAVGPRYVHLTEEGKASHPQAAALLTESLVVVSRSEDGGRTWHEASLLPRPHRVGATLFWHDGTLYMLLVPKLIEARSVWVAASRDGGTTWTDPVEVLNAPGSWYGAHQQSMVVQNGRLYWAVSERFREMVVLSCELARGALNPHAWRASNCAASPGPWQTGFANPKPSSMACLEGNVVVVDGKIKVIARTTIAWSGTPNTAAVYDLSDEDDRLDLRFVGFHPLPGGQCKFFIAFDEISRLYWMTSNLPATSSDDRRVLMLWYAKDALNWFPAGVVARAERHDQSFMYPSMVIDGDDLAILSRTSRDSNHFHDSDLLTFHRVPAFRSLAMDL